MAENFVKIDSDWWAQDLPLDADGLGGVSRNLRAVWDRCAPVLTYNFPGYEAPLDSSPSDSSKIGMYSGCCLWARPFFLLPDTEKLRLHFYGVLGPAGSTVTLQLGQSIGAMNRNAPLVEGGKDVVVVTGSNDPQIVTLELDWGVNVNQPTFTVLQLWMTSNKVSGGEGTPITLGADRVSRNWVVDPGLATYPDTDAHLHVLQYYDSDGNERATQDIYLYANDPGLAGGGDAFFVYPSLDEQDPAWDEVSLDQISWVTPGGLALEIVRKPSDTLYLPENYETEPDAFAYSQIMDKLQSVSEELTFRHRPLTFDIQHSIQHSYPDDYYPAGALYAEQGYNYSTEADTHTPISIPHEQSQVVRVALLVTAWERGTLWEREYRNTINASFEAEILEADGTSYASLDVEVSDATQEEISVLGVASDRLLANWSPQQIYGSSEATNRFNRQPIMSEADLDAMVLDKADRAWSLVILTLRGVPAPTKYSSSVQEQPYILRLAMSIDDGEWRKSRNQIFSMMALPYVWTEGYKAATPTGAATGDEQVGVLRVEDDDLWFDLYSYKSEPEEVRRAWGFNLRVAGAPFGDLSTYSFDRLKIIGGGAEVSLPPAQAAAVIRVDQVAVSEVNDPDNVPHVVAVPDQGGWIVGQSDKPFARQIPIDGSGHVWYNSAKVEAPSLYERFARCNNGSGQSEDILALGEEHTRVSLVDWDSGASRVINAFLGTGIDITGSKETALGAVLHAVNTLTVFRTDLEYEFGIPVEESLAVSVEIVSSIAHCLFLPPDTSEGWTGQGGAIIAASSGTRDYADIFGGAPEAGDLLILLAFSQGASGANAPTITGFTRQSDWEDHPSGPNGSGWVLAYTRVATGSEGTDFSYSGWTNASGASWDALHGLLIPSGTWTDYASSDALERVTSTPPDVTGGWGSDQKVSVFTAIMSNGTTPVTPPSGYTEIFDYGSYTATARRFQLSELKKTGNTESPGNWNTSGHGVTFMVQGTQNCVAESAEEALSPLFGVIATIDEVLETGEEFAESPDALVEVVSTIAEAINFSDVLGPELEVVGDVNETALPFIVDSVSDTAFVGFSDDWVLDRSSTFAAGDQEYAIIAFTSTSVVPSATGWTTVASDTAAGSRPGLVILTRTMSGGEGSTFSGAGASVDVLTCHHIVVRNAGSSVGKTQGSTRNPPSQAYTPSPHDNSPALVIEAIAVAGEAAINSYSSGFTEILTTDGGSLNLGTAHDVAESSPGDPGIISISVSASNAICGTLVIKGS